MRIDAAALPDDVAREDLAEILAELLHDPRASHRILYLNGGEDPVEQTLADVVENTGAP